MEDTDFLIPLKGLTRSAEFGRHVGKELFESFGNAEILDASVEVRAVATKNGSCIDVDCKVSGSVTSVCDRCLSDLEIPVDLDLALRFGPEEALNEDEGREVVVMEPEATDIDLRQIVYDYVCLSVPLRKVHPDGECDPEVVRHLCTGEWEPAEVEASEGDDAENPFAALKEYFENNN